MASLTEDPSLTRSTQAVRNERLLLNKAYRQAKRRGDFEQALKLSQYGERAGTPVGRPVNDTELAGTAAMRYESDLQKTGAKPAVGGLAGFDFRQAKDRGELFAGTGFEQVGKMQPAQPAAKPVIYGAGGAMDQGPQMPDSVAAQQGGLLPPPVNAPAQPTTGQQLMQRSSPVDMFRDLWNKAGSEEEKDQIVEDAYAQGVPLSDMGKQIIERRRNRAFFQEIPQQPQTQAPPALGQNMYSQPGVGGAFASLLRRNKNPLTSRI